MLRFCFDHPPRREEGELKQLFELIGRYGEKTYRIGGRSGGRVDRPQRLLLWARSLEVTIDELEQSEFCSRRFAERVKERYLERMSEEERLAYRRHLYFFRNGFIRVFASLDKLGSFMDDHFDLHTARVKERFSYFTVLRRLKELGRHEALRQQLVEIKEQFRTSMQELRFMRNHEVHALNVELLDDLGHLRLRSGEPWERIEDLRYNGERLRDGCRMVIRSTETVFRYILKQ